MLLRIPDVLTPAELSQAGQLLHTAEWVDGRATAGHQSSRVKDNVQLPEGSPVARQLGDTILAALGRSALFLSAALPARIFPPLFNRYSGGQSFGTHVDNAIRLVGNTGHRVRTDLSATLFLCDPAEYDGGELIVEDTYGVQSVKLAAGSLVLYPATSLHRVEPVARGTRTCSFFWVQSMVRDDGRRSLLFDLDTGIQRLAADHPDHPSAVMLTGVYHNLLRQWAEI